MNVQFIASASYQRKTKNAKKTAMLLIISVALSLEFGDPVLEKETVNGEVSKDTVENVEAGDPLEIGDTGEKLENVETGDILEIDETLETGELEESAPEQSRLSWFLIVLLASNNAQIGTIASP